MNKTLCVLLFVLTAPIFVLCQNKDSIVIDSTLSDDSILYKEILDRLNMIDSTTMQISSENAALNKSMEDESKLTQFILYALLFIAVVIILASAIIFSLRKQLKELAKGNIDDERARKENLENDLRSEIDRKGSELKELKNERVNLEDRVERAEQDALLVSSKIKELIGTVIKLNQSSNFVHPFKNVIDQGDDIVQYAMKMANKLGNNKSFTIESTILCFMINKYHLSCNRKEDIRWRGILENLIYGFVSDPYLVKNISDIKSDEQKLEWIEKPLYVEFIKGYISNTLILLEELKNLKCFVPKRGRTENKIYESFEKEFGKKQDEFIEGIKNNLVIEVNYVPICKSLKSYSKIAEATDKLPISPYYKEIEDIAKGESETFIIEIGSYSTNSKYENQKTVVKTI